MQVSKSWLKELVDVKDIEEVERLLPLRTIGIKEITDNYIELDMKGYNRADLLSMRGVAREVAAISDSKVKFEDEKAQKYDLPKTNVQVEDEKLLSVYCVAKIENLKVEHSGDDRIQKLFNSGLRTVNNIADITNLIMLEFGQPIHAFDADKVSGQILIVRTAKAGEKLTTLDNKTRELDQTDLLITDNKKALGLAGVMGGKYSEVSDSTTTILLEAAIFDPISIRKTVQRHNLPSEASKRFQHGLTKTNLLQAFSAAIKMYEGLGGKLTAISLTGDLTDQPKTVNLRHEKVNSLIGIKLSIADVEQSLNKLGFHLERTGANVNHLEGGIAWHVRVPYWRLDINIEEDLIEEVARIYGYEKIPAKELVGELPESIDQSLPNFIYNLKKSLAEGGLTEVQTYSFYSTRVLGSLEFDQTNKKNAVKIANPISSETEYMRTFIWPNLVEVIEKNMKQGYKDIAIFEIGKVYSPGIDDLPQEGYRLTIALMNGSDNPIEELVSLAGNLPGCKLEQGEMMKELETLFHPTRFATVKASDKIVGGLAEVHPRFLNHFGIDKRVAILEISIEGLM